MTTLEDVGVVFLTCDANGVDTSTPRGRHFFAHLVNDAQLEAELVGERAQNLVCQFVQSKLRSRSRSRSQKF